MAYVLPEGLEMDEILSRAALEAIAGQLVMVGDLPFLGPEFRLPTDDDACLALAEVIDRLQIAHARSSPAAFVQYAFRHERTDEPIVNASHHGAWHRFFDANKLAILFAPVEHAKAVPTDTEVPTPQGWTTMGDIRPGDMVFGRDGRPARVSDAHPVLLGQRVYELEFSDGARHRACESHLWIAWTQHDRDSKRPPRIVTTREIAQKVKHRAGYWWKVPLPAPVQYPEGEFPIHPYVLGVWLGDGHYKSAMVTFNELDLEIADRCVRLDNGLRGKSHRNPDVRAVRINIGGDADSKKGDDTLRSRLRAMGLLGNKHIPEPYMRASEAQRRELLAGLLDTDGTVATAVAGRRVSFSQSNEPLARQVLELVRSLGYRATIRCSQTTHKDSWSVHFTPHDPVFRLGRKLARQIVDGDRTRTDSRSIVACREVESVPVRCLTVESPDGSFLVGRDYAVTHNSQHAIGRIVWQLGKDPSKRMAVISDTAKPQAVKILRSIRVHITDNPRVRKVFPALKRSTKPGDPWDQTSITVERNTIAKEASVQSLGLFGPINGARLDGILLDDILDFENTRTPEQIEKVIGWLDSTAFRRPGEDGWVHWIGTPWNLADPMHKIAERAGWASQTYCAVDNPDEPMDRWRPMWPEQFSQKRLQDIYNSTTPINFARKYLCKVRMDATSRFQQAWIDAALAAGRGRHFVERQPHGPAGNPWRCYTGVDLGVGQKEGHDLTVIFTVAIDDRGRKCVVNIQAGRWQAPDIVGKIRLTISRYNSLVYVENNAAQDFIVQWMSGEHLPVVGFTTTAGKKYDEHFGIESMAVEMRNGGWVIPSGDVGQELHPEVQAWIDEMLFYTPDAHTGDRLMASWLAREASRNHGVGVYGSFDSIAR